MGLTVTINEQTIFGNKRVHFATIGFDSSYASGGESISAINLGLSILDYLKVDSRLGYLFDFDKVNGKVKVLKTNAPPIIFEEVVAVEANVGYLRYPAAFISYVADNSGTPKPYIPVIGGITPAANQVSVDKGWNYTTGVFTRGQRCKLTFAAADSVSSVVVTYVTQAWKDVVDNLVLAKWTAGVRIYGNASMAETSGTPDVWDFGEAAVAIESITHNTTGTTFQETFPIYKGATAAAKEATIDWSNTTNTTFATLGSQNWDAAGHSVYVDYVKKPSAGMLSVGFTEEEDLTPSTDVITFTSLHPLLFGTIGQIAGPTTKYAQLVSTSSTIGATATYIQPTTHPNLKPAATWAAMTATLGSSHADSDHLKPSFVKGNFLEIQTTAIEVVNGEDLTFLSDVTVIAYGS